MAQVQRSTGFICCTDRGFKHEKASKYDYRVFYNKTAVPCFRGFNNFPLYRINTECQCGRSWRTGISK